MTQGLNKVLIVGYLGRKPEMRYTPGGTAVTSFSLTRERTWTTADGHERQVIDWFNVVAWRKLAELCNQQLSKNQHVLVEGRLQTQRWKDDRDRLCHRTEIVANEIVVLGDQRLSGTAPSEADTTPRADSKGESAASALDA